MLTVLLVADFTQQHQHCRIKARSEKTAQWSHLFLDGLIFVFLEHMNKLRLEIPQHLRKNSMKTL